MKKHRKIVPPADIILDMLNDERDVDTKIIQFYGAYIAEMAKEPKYTTTGQFIGYEINEDLMQELKLVLFRALPKLRQAFHKRFGGKKPMIVIIAERDQE